MSNLKGLFFFLLLSINPTVASTFLEGEANLPDSASKRTTKESELEEKAYKERLTLLERSHKVRGAAALSFYMLDAFEEAGVPQVSNVRYGLLGTLTIYELYTQFSAYGTYKAGLSEGEMISTIFGPILAFGEWMMIYGNSLPYPPTLEPDAKALVRVLPVFIPALSYFTRS